MMFSLVVFAYPWFAFQFLLFEINMDFHPPFSTEQTIKKPTTATKQDRIQEQ
jgi:hypothetical protein